MLFHKLMIVRPFPLCHLISPLYKSKKCVFPSSTCFRTDLRWQLVASALVTLSIWLFIIYTLRYTFKLLLMYKGWMYEARGRGGKISTKTKIWLVFVKILSGWNKPKLYSFQGSLPRLPLPSVHDTMLRVSKYFSIIF